MSEAYAVPGVYVTESNGLSLSIQSGETAVPVFVGLFNAISPPAKGEVLKCIRIESWQDFTSYFAASDRITVSVSDSKVKATSYAGSYSVRMYFENGGGPCYVLGINRREDLDDGTIYEQIGPAIEQYPDITLLCWCEAISTVYDTKIYKALGSLLGASATSGGNRGRFLLADAWVKADKTDKDDLDKWDFITPDVADKAQVATYFPALRTRYTRNFAAQADHGIVVKGFTDAEKALLTAAKLNTVSEIPISLYAIRAAAAAEKPNKPSPPKVDKAADGDPKPTETKTLKELVTKIDHLLSTKLADEQKIADQVDLRASVAMAGVYARVDRERGVWKAPANVGISGVKELIVGGQKDEHTKIWSRPIRVDHSLNDKVAKVNVNAIREFRGQGATVWGAHTMVPVTQPDWLYVPVRRLFNAVERDARAALRQVVFEPNSPATWEQVRGALESYLHGLWRKGALQGDSPSDAYNVQIGLGTTMTQADIKAGILKIRVGLAAVRPAEFIVLELTQDVVSG